jgi:rRNA-processing protein FCF1
VKELSNIIILDANFILLPAQFKIHYLEEISFNLEGKSKFIIFQQVIDELKAKESRKQKNQKSIKFEIQLNTGLSYLQKFESKFKIEFINEKKRTNETTDEFLLRKAKDMKRENVDIIFLATNDYVLRKKAFSMGISVIYLRQKSKIEVKKV